LLHWLHTGYTGYTGYTYTGYTICTCYTGYTGYSGYTGYTGYSGYKVDLQNNDTLVTYYVTSVLLFCKSTLVKKMLFNQIKNKFTVTYKEMLVKASITHVSRIDIQTIPSLDAQIRF